MIFLFLQIFHFCKFLSFEKNMTFKDYIKDNQKSFVKI